MTDEVINTAPTPGSAEHDAAMAAKMDASLGNTQVAQEQPAESELILGKFKSQEDLATAYKELEAKIGSKEAKDTQSGNEDTQDGNAAEEVVTEAGLNFDAMAEEYAANGGLKDETYEALAEAGIPKELVDQYIRGQEAMVEKLQLTAYSVAGGEENYTAMAAWASANMTEAEIEVFNKAVNATNPDIVKMAVMGLKGRYEADNGSEPQLAGGDFGATTGSVFESWAQVREAMKDPKYSKDPAYRRDVEQKLGRSNPM